MMVVSSIKQAMADCKRWVLSEKGYALFMIISGAFFVVVGVHRFLVRPEHFGLPNVLGCIVGAFGGFFLLLITDYLLHHARLVFIPWCICLIYFAIIQPHLGVGLGLALWYMLFTQLTG
jgi:hypothetical protein